MSNDKLMGDHEVVKFIKEKMELYESMGDKELAGEYCNILGYIRKLERAAQEQACIVTWTPLTQCLPDPSKHARVLIYTEGSDFAGEQFFDVEAESLNECFYECPEDQPEVCKAATHWMATPIPATHALAAKNAERWQVLEYLWFISESLELRLSDGDLDRWQLVFEGAECAGKTWTGGDLAEIVDTIKAEFDSQPDPEAIASGEVDHVQV